MGIDALRAVLDQFEEPAYVTGTAKPAERVAIALPNGDVGAVDDPKFVDWLLAHAELAPYGAGTETKLDKQVRNAQRLVARDQVQIHGFDPASILPDIEAALSPGARLEAKLTDVIVYPKGGKFARHKDTPRATTLVATLVVGLPIPHTGGAFVIDDGRTETKLDWSKSHHHHHHHHHLHLLPWVALFTDVDHAIEPVKSGARVTLVYALHRTATPRTDAAWTQRRAAMRAAATDLAPPRWPLMIACSRHALTEPGTKQPQPIDTLRGLDRDLAEVLVEAGYTVGVRACIAPMPDYEPPDVPRGAFPTGGHLFSVTRLNATPPPDVIESLADEGGWDIADYMHDSISLDQWLIRKHAAATLAQERAQWAEDPSMFGNEGYDAILYSLAAIEVSKPAKAKPAKVKPASKANPASKAKPPSKPQAKPPAKAKAKR